VLILLLGEAQWHGLSALEIYLLEDIMLNLLSMTQIRLGMKRLELVLPVLICLANN
jgi:hypothetical protein